MYDFRGGGGGSATDTVLRGGRIQVWCSPVGRNWHSRTLNSCSDPLPGPRRCAPSMRIGLVFKRSWLLLPAVGSSVPSTPPVVSRHRHRLCLRLRFGLASDVSDVPPPPRRCKRIPLLICCRRNGYLSLPCFSLTMFGMVRRRDGTSAWIRFQINNEIGCRCLLALTGGRF